MYRYDKSTSVIEKYKQSFITLGVIVAVAVLGFGVLKIYQNAHRSPVSEQKAIIAKVSKLLVLPSGEEPALATITDTKKLTNNAFLAKAKNGDKVLLYAKNQKAIIYRPSLNKIVDIGPILSGKDGSVDVTARVTILNGSGVADNTPKAVASLLAKFPNATLIAKQDAPRLFPKTIIVDVTKKNQPLAEQIADTLGFSAGQIPLGIIVPNGTEILIIIGQQ